MLKLEGKRLLWFTCSKCLGKKWGLKPYIARWIYTAVVRPVLCYGALVWWHTTKLLCRKVRLSNVQRQACMGISGAIKSTPQAALEVILNIIPLELHLKGLACNSASRLIALGYFKMGSKKGHRGITDNMPSQESLKSSDYSLKEVVLSQHIDVHVPTRELWDQNQVIRRGELEIYTDGSKTEVGTGAGVFCEELHVQISEKMDNSCTVFQAEVLALKLAADHLISKNINGRDISFYVDSQAAITALNNYTVSSKLVKECRKSICKVDQSNSVRICWVPGHRDHKGNEEADRLAKLGSNDMTLSISLEAKPPLSYSKRNIIVRLREEWMRVWSISKDCTITKLFWPETNEKKTRECLGNSRRRTRTLMGIFTGHCLLNKHAKVMRLSTTDECRFCQDLACKEDIVHLLNECPALERQRFLSLGHPQVDIGEFSSLSIKELKGFIGKFSSLVDIFPF